MERLTYWNEEYGCWSYHGPSGDAAARLAAYEDTGLEPCDYSAMGHALQKAERTQADLTEIIRIIGGVGLDRLRELTKAEKDGRLVALPCKVGDVVFDIADGTAYATRVLSFSYFGDHWACRTVSSYPDLEQFGRRIFLTREEAEATLKGGGE